MKFLRNTKITVSIGIVVAVYSHLIFCRPKPPEHKPTATVKTAEATASYQQAEVSTEIFHFCNALFLVKNYGKNKSKHKKTRE